jgi:hypothetical protein
MSNVYQLRVGAVSSGKNFWQIVMHFSLDESLSADPILNAKALIDGFRFSVLPTLLPALSNDTQINMIDAKRVTGPGGASIAETISVGGSEGTATVSTIMATDIAFYPGGALNRPGHIYLGGVPSDAVVQDVLQPAFVTLLTTFASQIIIPFALPAGSADAIYVTYTRKTKTGTTATSFSIKPKLTAMNKRTLPVT